MRTATFWTLVVLYSCWAGQLVRAVLWTEDAENGAANIIDGTSGSYSLIQSQVAGEGDYAFHLAHPIEESEWFELDQTLTIQPDTKLFFQSRLGYADLGQSARVQVSTDGGSSWLTNIFTQSGTGNAGEGGFSLKEIDLSPYANQDLRFRFFYDLGPGFYYPQVDPGVGWYVDDIQIASELEKTLYSIGNPTPHEQQYLEYINRARANAVDEAHRLAGETDPDILDSYGFFGIDPSDIVYQFTESVANGYLDLNAQPLSFNAALVEAAQLHSTDMLNNEFQGHGSSGNPPAPFQEGYGPQARAEALGYSGGVGENVFAYADSVAQGHAGFDVDWGNESPGAPGYNPNFDGQVMQNPAGHRRNIHRDDYKEVGIGVINDSNGSVGPQIVTQDFGLPGDATFVTGVVFEDLNGNAFYDIGEGREGVRVDVDGSGYYAISTESGGYSVPVSGDGLLDVTFTSEDWGTYQAVANIIDGRNFKIDFLVTPGPLFAADFDGDGDVDADDLTDWEGAFGSGAGGDADGDGDTDGADFLVWQREFGSGALVAAAGTTVPEPGTLGLLVSCLGLITRVRRR